MSDSLALSEHPSVLVCAAAAALHERAQQLAQRYGLSAAPVPAQGYALVVTEQRLELRQLGEKAPGPVYVDFVGGAVGHRRRFGGGRGQPIAKAVGLGAGRTPTILDATAGLGRDAFVFASLGCRVTLVERSAAVRALLEDGLRRAAQDEEVAPIAARMHLVSGDAATLLASLERELSPDVVYLDPMYPHRAKSALVKKEMRIFQEVVGADPDADRLLPLALAAARYRVVVKRPDYAEPLAGKAPTLSIPTKSNRFDVYVLRSMAHAEKGGGD